MSRFIAWLDTTIKVEAWMPSIQLEATLPVTRSLLIRIGGNISKHNVLRLGRTAKDLQKVLAEAGHAVTQEASLLALTDVHERFHNDVLNYHSSTLAEFLNNIRWGIHEYLAPEWQRSFTREPPDPIKYRYIVPPGIENPMATDCYWNAMNDVRAKPYVRRFTATEWLKKRH